MKDNNSIISYIAICVSSICLICLITPWLHIRLIDVNYVISVLSILITILIGWNIFQLIDFKSKTNGLNRKYKELEKRIKESKENEHELGASIHSSISNVYFSTLVKVYGMEYFFLCHKIGAIIHNSHLGRFGQCNKHIKDVFKIKEMIQNTVVSKDDKSFLKRELRKVSNPENIYGWKELILLIENLKCFDDKNK